MNKVEIICSIIASIALILGGVWFIIEKAIKSGVDKQRLDALENTCSSLPEKTTSLSTKIDGLPCNTHMENIREYKTKVDDHVNQHNEVSTELTRVSTSIEFMQKTLDALNMSIQNISNPKPNSIFTASRSPLSITDSGWETVEKLGIYDLIEHNWTNINYLIDENTNSMNPYDIQQFCIQHSAVFPEKFLNENDLNIIKIEAYQQGIPLIEYMKVIAVLVRDRYFDEHGIDVNEVDKHDPQYKPD